MPDVKPHDKKALNFLKAFRSEGYHNLVAIHPVTEEITGITRPIDSPELLAFIERNNGNQNLYYSVNEPSQDAPDNKLTKHHIKAINAVWLDADPKKDLPFEREKERLAKFAADLKTGPNPPTYITDSGGGIQVFWLLEKPLEATKDNVIVAESLSRGLAEQYGTDFVQNIDRIMRIPFTVNIPTAKKKKLGRERATARIIHAASPRGIRYDDLPFIVPSFKADAEENFTHTAVDMEALKKPLKDDLVARLKDTLGRDKKAHDIYYGLIEKPSRSEYDFTLTQQLVWDNYTLQDVAHILWHYTHGKGKDLTKREIIRCYNRVENPFIGLDPDYIANIETQTNPILAARAAGKPLEEDLKKKPSTRRGLIHASKASHKSSGIPIIKNFFDQQSMVILFGPPNSGKSFATLDIGMSIAAGKTHWGQFKIKQKMGVLVVCGEAGQSYGKRVEATRHRFGFNDATTFTELPFAYLDNYYDLMNNTDHLQEIKNCIIELEQRSSHKCGLLIIDTLSATFGSGKENAAEDARKYLNNLKQIGHDLKVTILIVHHTGKDENSGARGSSVFLGDVDTQLKVNAVKRGERYERTVVSTKQRDTEKDQVTRFGLMTVELALDDDGDPVTTCHLVMEGDIEFKSAVPSVEQQLNTNAKHALNAIRFYNAIPKHDLDKIKSKHTEKQIKTLVFSDLKNHNGIFDMSFATNAVSKLNGMQKPKDADLRAFERGCNILATEGLTQENVKYQLIEDNYDSCDNDAT